ncbi:MAG: multicopper oxidase domain-containing protein, partial [Spirochaetales bacterium]|nr:multicopper oxidase domain-containing protein [Spirochaetales bacterium]
MGIFILAGGVLSAQGDILPVPPLLEGPDKLLTIQEGELTLPFGTSETLGYNGDYLGPTIRVSRGEQAAFTIKNTLDEASTVHWHGLHVPAEFDGGPRQIIEAGESWSPEFLIDQAAATLWYHPHLMGKTAEHAYRGLAGLFIVEDDYSRSLPLPREYGVNDFPLILQDRRVDRQGEIRYRPSMPDIMHGYLGNIVLTNGAYQPALSLPDGTYRFRLLNGSNSSVL